MDLISLCQMQTQLARMKQQLDTVVAAGMMKDEFSRRFGSENMSPDGKVKLTPAHAHAPPPQAVLLDEPPTPSSPVTTAQCPGVDCWQSLCFRLRRRAGR